MRYLENFKIHVQQEEYYALRFHWMKDIMSREVLVLRITQGQFSSVLSIYTRSN